MTMTNGDTRSVYPGNDVTTGFGFTFPVQGEDEVAVWLRDAAGLLTLQVNPTHYTVALANGGASGGTVTMVTPPATGEYLSLLLDPPRVQDEDYKASNAFPSLVNERNHDYSMSLLKRIFDDEFGRILRMQDGAVVAASDPFDALSKRIANVADPENAQDAATQAWVQAEIINAALGGPGYTISPYMAGMMPELTAADVMTYLTLSAFFQSGVAAADLQALLTAWGVTTYPNAFLRAADQAGMQTQLGVSAFIQTLLDDLTAANARTTLGIDGIVELENIIINGDFQVWQWGESFTGATTPANNDDTYVSDQWILLSDGNDIADISKLSSTLPDGSRGGIKMTATGTGGSRFGILQPIESKTAIALRSKTVSIGVDLLTTGGLHEVSVMLVEWTGTADAITSDIIGTWNSGTATPAAVTGWTLLGEDEFFAGSGWSRFELENIAIGGAANNLALFIYVSDVAYNAGNELWVSGVTMTESAVASDFRSLPLVVELDRCKRFFQKTFPYGTVPAHSQAIDGALKVLHTPAIGPYGQWRFNPEMRIAPTITYYSPINNADPWRRVSGAGAGAANLATAAATNSAKEHFVGAAEGDTGENRYAIHITADARL